MLTFHLINKKTMFTDDKAKWTDRLISQGTTCVNVSLGAERKTHVKLRLTTCPHGLLFQADIEIKEVSLLVSTFPDACHIFNMKLLWFISWECPPPRVPLAAVTVTIIQDTKWIAESFLSRDWSSWWRLIFTVWTFRRKAAAWWSTGLQSACLFVCGSV